MQDLTLPASAAFVSLLLAASAAKRDLGIPFHAGAPAALLAAALLAAALPLTGMAIEAAVVISPLLVICGLIAEIDRRHHLVPDPLTIGIVILALVQPFGDTLWLRAVGALLLGAFFLSIRQAFAAHRRDDALGIGDIKLAAAIGAFLGPEPGLIAVAFAGTATVAVIALTPRRSGNAAAASGLGAPFGIGLAAALACLSLWRIWVLQ